MSFRPNGQLDPQSLVVQSIGRVDWKPVGHCGQVTLNVSCRRNGMSPNIESAFSQIGERVLRTLREIPSPDGTVYACGFWLFYCDYTVLTPPCFAYNIVGKEQDAKWCPPEWIVDVENRMVDALKPIYQELSDLMKGQNDEAWESLIRYQWDFYSQLCLAITRDARSLLSHWRLAGDFVCGIFEDRESEEVYTSLVLSSVGEQAALQLGILPSS